MGTQRHRAFLTLVALALAAVLLAGCAAGDPRFTEGEPAGFLFGLWHGFIIIVTFVIGLFADQVAIYEAHNTGSWYDFGFLLGVLLMGGGCASPWKKARKTRIATDMKNSSCSIMIVATALLLQGAGAAYAAEFHVTPDGTPEGDGSETAPWDLAFALSHPTAVAPGDTIWLRAGTHLGGVTSTLTGEEGAPVTVRAFPGEQPVIDGASSDNDTFTVQGRWTVFMGFEIMNSDPDRWDYRAGGMNVLGQHIKLVNLVIHDLGNNGFWSPATAMEMHGCIIFHNGYDASDRGHGHAIYAQNLNGTKVFSDNIIFGGYSFGFHIYTEGGSIQGFDLEGNTWFNAGIVSTVSGHKDDCLIGGGQIADRISLAANMGWGPGPGTRSIQLGYYALTNGAVTLEDNYVVGRLDFSQPWETISMTGNTIVGQVAGIAPAAFPDNDFLGAAPTVTVAFVRPNRYDSDRAHVVVYNWEGLDTVAVDASKMLEDGDEYLLLDGENPLAGPVGGGISTNGEIQVPMELSDAAQAIGSPASFYPHTPADFGVYVLLRTAAGSDGDSDSDSDGDSDSDTDDADGGQADGSKSSGGCGCVSPGGAARPMPGVWGTLLRLRG